MAIRIVHRSDSPQVLGEVVTGELRHLLARLAKGDPFDVNHDDSRRVVSPAHIEAVYDGDDTIWLEGLGGAQTSLNRGTAIIRANRHVAARAAARGG